ncbi:hypothetical protein LDENG_00274360 [Lucifuga dentata]|nr:hypothetical protein LDENG_00274360 [Lucifuga dentata]
MFRSGFDLCAKEVLQYLRSQESGSDHLTPSCVISHIHKVAADVLQFGIRLHPESVPHPPDGVKKPTAPRASEGHAKNCVPVIQRTCPNGTGEQSGSDTDTDSGYGGEQEKREFKAQWSDGDMRGQQLSHILSERTAAAAIKREGDKPHAKRLRSDSSEEELLSRQMAGGPGSYTTFSPSQPPFCLPFYLLSPTAAAAAYLPMLEKCWYPGGVPVMYPSASLSPVSLVTSWWADSPAAAQTPRESAATASD